MPIKTPFKSLLMAPSFLFLVPFFFISLHFDGIIACLFQKKLLFGKKFVKVETKQQFGRHTIMWQEKNHDFIARLKSGDKQAFEQLFREYKNMVYTIVNRMVFNKGRVDDLAADIFLKIYQNIQRFDERSKLSTWMYRIAYNHCLDYIKAAKRDPLESSEPVDTMYGLSSKEMGADTMVLKKEQEGVLHKIMATMPEKYRMVLNFYYFEEISYNEMSEIMGIPVGTVKTYLFRAKEYLKEKMKKMGVL